MKDAILRESGGRAMPIILACGFVLFVQPCGAQVGEGIRGVTQLEQSNARSNIVTFQELTHNVPKTARAEMEKADKASAKDRSDEAIQHLNRAILMDPEYVAARNNLAVIYFKMGKSELAIAQLEEAVKVDPHNATLFTNLSVGLLKINKLDGAERAARTTLDLDRTSASQARMLLGLALIRQGKFTDEALECFSRSREEYPLARLLAGGVLIAQSKPERAKPEIQMYLSSPAPDCRAAANRWLALIDQGKETSAVMTPATGTKD